MTRQTERLKNISILLLTLIVLQKFMKPLKAIGRLFQRHNIFQHFWPHHPPKDEIRIAIDNVALFIDRIEVTGWALAEEGIERVEVYVDTHYAGTAEYGRLRTDVGACYPNIPGSEQSGFMLSTRLDRIGQLHEEHQVIVKVCNRHGDYAEASSPVPVTLQPVGLFCDRAGLYSDIFIVSGWAVAEEGIACVEIALDSRVLGEADYGHIRPDVGREYPDVTNSSYSGFILSLRIEQFSQNHHEHAVLIRAISQNGRKTEETKAIVASAAPLTILHCDQAELYSNLLVVSGWAVSNTEIARIDIYVGERYLGKAQYGYARPDIERIYPYIAHSYYCGYHCSVDVQESSKLAYQKGIVVKAICQNGDCIETTETPISKKAIRPLNSLISSLHDSSRVLPREDGQAILLIDHDLGGGTNSYRRQFIEQAVKEGNRVFLLTYQYAQGVYNLTRHVQRQTTAYIFKECDLLLQLVPCIPFQQIVINNIVSYPDPFSMLTIFRTMQETCGSALTIIMHDYYAICSSYHLLNDQGVYCALPDLQECQRCLAQNTLKYLLGKFHDIERWRKAWSGLFQHAKHIVCFSNSSKSLIKKAYPDIPDHTFTIIPHSVDYIAPVRMPPNASGILHIGILGNIIFQKGSKIIASMIELIEKRQIQHVRMIVIGQIIDERINSPYLTITGEYTIDRLAEFVKRHQIDLFFLPSICPETFSLTTEEIIKMNLPLAVFNLGAPGERVKHYEKGLIIDHIDPESALECMLHWFETAL